MNSIIYGLGVGLLTAIILSVLLGITLYFADVSHDLTQSIYIVTGYIGTGIAALVAGARAKTKGWLFGGASGLAYILLLYAGSTWLFSVPTAFPLMMVRAGIGGAVGIAGGILGVNLNS